MVGFFFMICALLSVTTNVVYLISCASPKLKEMAVYRVNVTRLAERLTLHALEDSGVEVAQPLVPPELPTWWYYGINGNHAPSHTWASSLELTCGFS